MGPVAERSRAFGFRGVRLDWLEGLEELEGLWALAGDGVEFLIDAFRVDMIIWHRYMY